MKYMNSLSLEDKVILREEFRTQPGSDSCQKAQNLMTEPDVKRQNQLIQTVTSVVYYTEDLENGKISSLSIGHKYTWKSVTLP